MRALELSGTVQTLAHEPDRKEGRVTTLEVHECNGDLARRFWVRNACACNRLTERRVKTAADNGNLPVGPVIGCASITYGHILARTQD